MAHGIVSSVMSRMTKGLMNFAPWIPVRTAFKNEVIKLSKKVRTIQIVSYFWQIVGKNCVEPLFASMRNVANFSGIGLVTRGGVVNRVQEYFKTMLGRIYSLDYEDAERKLATYQKAEMDKRAWEANTEYITARVMIVHWIAGIAYSRKDPLLPDNHRRLIASFFADFINPALPVDQSTFFARLGITPSGHILTLDGNTWRHVYMTIMFYLFARRHMGGLGSFCALPGCDICQKMPIRLSVEKLTKEQVQELLVFCCVGDDYYGLAHSLTEQLCWFYDSVCAQETVSEVKSDEEAEFLRSRLGPSRDIERVLAKLFYNTRDICIRLTSIQNLMFETGLNAEGYELLKRYHQFCLEESIHLDDERMERHCMEAWEEAAAKTNLLYMTRTYVPTMREIKDFHHLGVKERAHMQREFQHIMYYRTNYELN